MKILIDRTPFYKHRGMYWILPCISLWFDKYHFLETGVTSKALGFSISWINYSWGITIQEGY